jgi:tRNA A-37 threonylcarbamoyl transferase component Bud32
MAVQACCLEEVDMIRTSNTPVEPTIPVPGKLPHNGHRAGPALLLSLPASLRQLWERGERLSVEDYLRREPGLQADDEAILDLVCTEFTIRAEQGEAPQVDEYTQRFPKYGERLRALLSSSRAAQDGTAAAVRTIPGQGEPAPAATAPAQPRIGKYLVLEALGRGGQGCVYRAFHPALGKEVVLKVGRRPVGEERELRDTLLEEGRLLASLDHPNLARVHDLDFDEGRPFLVMEYIHGRNLEQYAAQEHPGPRRAAGLLAEVARALAAAHRRGIAHRDVKPGNIVIDEGGTARLIDFGLANLRDAWGEEVEPEGTIAGTTAYMAPEQARGETDRVGPASDLFGLGGALYFLLTGRPLFAGATLQESLQRARSCTFDRQALQSAQAPRRLKAICLRLLAADPAARYASADEAARELQAVAQARPLWPWLAVGLAAALGLVWWLGGKPAQPLPGDGATKGQPPAFVQPGVGKRSPPVVSHPSLFVRVAHRERYRDLIAAAPLRTGAAFWVYAEVPPHLHAALFLFNSEGKLEHLGSRAPGAVLRFPPSEGKSAVLSGPPGTELVLVCGRSSGPVTRAQVLAAWGGNGPWPALRGGWVLRLQTDRVVEEQKERGIGGLVDQPDPAGEVLQRLERLRRRLAERFDYFEGLAFAHEK